MPRSIPFRIPEMLSSAKPDIDSALGTNVAATRPVDPTLEPLLRKCREGNREAQQQLYFQFHQPVFRLLLRMVGKNDAADAMQDVFLQVFRSLNQFNGDSQFETWIYRVAYNCALQHLRKRRRWRWLALGGDFMELQSERSQKTDEKELLESALAKLEPELRAIFLLREVEKYSYSEIADATQVPEGTIASRLNRARQLLKQHLVELGWEP